MLGLPFSPIKAATGTGSFFEGGRKDLMPFLLPHSYGRLRDNYLLSSELERERFPASDRKGSLTLFPCERR